MSLFLASFLIIVSYTLYTTRNKLVPRLTKICQQNILFPHFISFKMIFWTSETLFSSYTETPVYIFNIWIYYFDSECRKKPSKQVFSLDSVASLRKKEDIIRSGGYERDTYVPPKGKGKANVCFTDLVQSIEMIIFESLLTTFITSVVFWGGWGGSSKKRLEPKI